MEKEVNPICKAEIDQFIDRNGTGSEKYDLRQKLFGDEEVLPMWVADMDIATPEFIIDTLKQRLDHSILGYTLADDATYQSIIDWQAKYRLKVKKQEIVFTHNVAHGFHTAIQACTKPKERVLVFTPVYPPFITAATFNDRVTIEQPLIPNTSGEYELDLREFENNIIDHQIKALLFCNPHNPIGKVWTETELTTIITICNAHNVTIISDEIHADLTFQPNIHKPLASLSNAISTNCITLNSPGKTFNMGGMQIGYAIISNKDLRETYQACLKASGIEGLHLLGYEAIKAAYSSQGWQWKDALLEHLKTKIDRFIEVISRELPKVLIAKPEATYLVWINFAAYFNTQQELKDWWNHIVGIGLSNGQAFGGKHNSGDLYMRINLAVPSMTLDKVLDRITSASATLKATSKDLTD